MSPASTPTGQGPIARKKAAEAAQGSARRVPAPSARAGKGGPGSKQRVPALDPDELAALEEQRDFLLASIRDLDREHDAGDLEDDDYQTLKDDYTARAADVLRAIDERHAAFADARRPRSLARTFAWVAGIALFALVSGVMVAKAMGARGAGETSSGGITVAETPTQKANACLDTMSTDPEATLGCLEKLIEKDHENAVALTWSAWLTSLKAENFDGAEKLTLQGIAAIRLDDAVEAAPGYSYARAFRAVVAYRNGRLDDAERYLQDFKDHDPSADAAGVIKQMDLEANIASARAAQAGGTTATTLPD